MSSHPTCTRGKEAEMAMDSDKGGRAGQGGAGGRGGHEGLKDGAKLAANGLWPIR